MEEKDFEDFDEEEFEMIINGLIHPTDMFMSPDMLAGAYPAPFGGGGMGAPGMGMPGGMPGGSPASFGSPYDAMLAEAYDEEDEQ
ncbi:MAG: hypothetical protein Q4D27_05100 [Coriobacteriia bacterium]|nr:hypothetical protein [Coriobacteriia bacterium]